jgi:hypothetical protein
MALSHQEALLLLFRRELNGLPFDASRPEHTDQGPPSFQPLSVTSKHWSRSR